MSIKIQVSR